MYIVSKRCNHKTQRKGKEREQKNRKEAGTIVSVSTKMCSAQLITPFVYVLYVQHVVVYDEIFIYLVKYRIAPSFCGTIFVGIDARVARSCHVSHGQR